MRKWKSAICISTIRTILVSFWQIAFSRSERENGDRHKSLPKDMQKSQTIRRSPTEYKGTLKSVDGGHLFDKTGSSAAGFTRRSSIGYLTGTTCSSSESHMESDNKKLDENVVHSNPC